jgi:hypothetical protein
MTLNDQRSRAQHNEVEEAEKHRNDLRMRKICFSWDHRRQR